MKINRLLPLGALLLTLGLSSGANAAETGEMNVYKTPWCGCCESWAQAMTGAGYNVKTIDLEDLSQVKAMAGVTDELEGCHTAIIAGYVLEGHVPLQAIEKLLLEKPELRGIAVPGMPSGALGMNYDENADYTVYGFFTDTAKQPVVFYQAG